MRYARLRSGCNWPLFLNISNVDLLNNDHKSLHQFFRALIFVVISSCYSQCSDLSREEELMKL